MSDPIFEAALAAEALGVIAGVAPAYLDGLDARPVRDHSTAPLLDALAGPLPEKGHGSISALEELARVGTVAATHSSGPRFFHFVTGGSTPAAQGADWLTSLLDQAGGLETASQLATRTETVVLDWLKDLFALPESFGGVLTPSATFANLTGLACARMWWASEHGVDVVADGLAGLPRMPVFSSGYVHASSRKAMQLLGLGRDRVVTLSGDDRGSLDLAALEDALRKSGPAVIIANAGEVNAGDFDPIEAMAELAERHGSWLHVDGAFGLFAALSPRTSGLLAGVERADSVASDGHKWLNVPYESGFAFVKNPEMLKLAFGSWGAAAAYLTMGDPDRLDYNRLGPESSRRARAFPIWATLRAYGREGHRAMVERHLDLARRLGDGVEASPELELMAPVRLNIVCFRATPAGVADLDDFNRRLGRAILEDGRVYLGTSIYRGAVVLRPAIVNWRTTGADIDLILDVIAELTARLLAE
ncbi:aspartate aminotransferase family protein [Actinorhabdospora filicis]|uniref:Aspartate aminotransferase family protein n=1 Tax=Actinorhabdospora filicis TaxID=1785913 RepID=A0A9W6SP21_9ACTN|nr:pyridoxal-dependent decarboxylase [Actinorhabdospora filicis]GLZ79513.1 aspartate aminotransferase family protein [Actinorhabdospora filicis]